MESVASVASIVPASGADPSGISKWHPANIITTRARRPTLTP